MCAQIGLARRDSPHKGGRHVGLAATLVHEMPGVLRALQRGDTSEWRATIIARETAHLSPEQRTQIDTAIADQLHGWGDARTEREARAWRSGWIRTGRRTAPARPKRDRRVSIRPAPDCMSYLTALLPMKQGVAVYGELHRRAMSAAVDPDEHRSRGQVMADELVNRIMTPAQGEPVQPAIEVHLVMTDRTLADADDEPAQVLGYGPVPAPVARDLVKADAKTKVWVRRVYTDPATGDLAGTDARRRDFPHIARMFLTARDQQCRTPYCGAPIRHADHALAASRGGAHRPAQRQRPLRPVQPHQRHHRLGHQGHRRRHHHHHHPHRPPTLQPAAPTPTSGPWRPPIQIDIQWPDTR